MNSSTIQEVFSIAIINDYYKTSSTTDFYLIPDTNTKTYLEQYSLKFIREDYGYKLIWLTKNIKNINECFEQKLRQLQFCFRIYLNNQGLYNFTQVTPGTVYNFTNNINTELLHVSDYVTESDTIEYSKYEKNFFGFVSIDISLLNHHKHNDYKIILKPISSFWHYNIKSANMSIKKLENFVINGIKYNFTNMETGKDKVYSCISEHAILLREPSYYNVNTDCLYEDQSNIVRITLPSPHTYNRISSNGTYVSDIFYYM